MGGAAIPDFSGSSTNFGDLFQFFDNFFEAVPIKYIFWVDLANQLDGSTLPNDSSAFASVKSEPGKGTPEEKMTRTMGEIEKKYKIVSKEIQVWI